MCQLEEAIRTQVNEGPVATYNAGHSFSELPNVRKAKLAKLLAVFVVDTHETEPDAASLLFALANLPEKEATTPWQEPTAKLQSRKWLRSKKR